MSSRASSKQFITSKSKDVEQQLMDELVPRLTSYGSVAFDEEPDSVRHANWVRYIHGFSETLSTFPRLLPHTLTLSFTYSALGYLCWPHYNCSHWIWCPSSTSIHCMDGLDRWHVHPSFNGCHHLVHISLVMQPHCHR